MINENHRYAQYARAHGETYQSMQERDRKEWPGGKNAGFILWNTDRIKEWCREVGIIEMREYGVDMHSAYDSWLERWVDRTLAANIGHSPTHVYHALRGH